MYPGAKYRWSVMGPVRAFVADENGGTGRRLGCVGWTIVWIVFYLISASYAALSSWQASENTVLAIALTLLFGFLLLAFLWFPLFLVIHSLRGGEGKTGRSSGWITAAVDGVFGLLYFLIGLALGHGKGFLLRALAFDVVPGISAFALFVGLPLSDWIRGKWEERHPRDGSSHE